jgi:hypothetical protein
MTSLFLSVLLMAQAPADPSPLTEEQIAKLRMLVRDTQELSATLTAELDAKERELGQVYAEYQLDERRAAALEAEIVELQRRKLANYHRMQVELRALVSKERFEVLKQRLRQAGFFGPK